MPFAAKEAQCQRSALPLADGCHSGLGDGGREQDQHSDWSAGETKQSEEMVCVVSCVAVWVVTRRAMSERTVTVGLSL